MTDRDKASAEGQAGSRGQAFHGQTAGGHARQIIGNIYKNRSFNYTLAKRRSDDGLREEVRNSELLRASAEGQYPRVQHLLRLGADFDYRDKYDLTALHHAVWSGFEDVVEDLKAIGADVNATSELAGRPICLAVLKKRSNILKLLLGTHPALVNLADAEVGTPLHCAAFTGDLDTVVALLSHGADRESVEPVNLEKLRWLQESSSRTSFDRSTRSSSLTLLGSTPLMVASRCGNADVVRKLLEHGALPDATDAKGHTALSMAARNNHQECIQALLCSNGADVNLKLADGTTPLLNAMTSGKSGSAVTLLQHKANPNVIHPEGWTPLAKATAAGNVPLMSYLLKYGALKGANHSSVFSSLMSIHKSRQFTQAAACLIHANASRTQPPDDVMPLLSRLQTTLQSYHWDGSSEDDIPRYLRCIADSGSVELLRCFLHLGVAIQSTNVDGETALHRSAVNGDAIAVRVLMEGGADVAARSTSGKTALSSAARNGYTEIVFELLHAGSDVDARDKSGLTALVCAAAHGKTDVVAVLLKAKADVHARDENGNTALHYATRNGHSQILAKLLRAGASWKVQNVEGFTALHLAAGWAEAALVTQLLNAGADVAVLENTGCTALHSAVDRGNAESVTRLLDAGADVAIENNDGWTALHCAASYGQGDIVLRMLNAKADPNIRTKSGITPLHLAAQQGHLDVVKKLLEAGVDVAAENIDGRTALHWAASYGRGDIVMRLLGAKADRNARAKYGDTPLHLAASEGHFDIAKKLLEAGSDVTARNLNQHSPKDFAMANKHDAVCELLAGYEAQKATCQVQAAQNVPKQADEQQQQSQQPVDLRLVDEKLKQVNEEKLIQPAIGRRGRLVEPQVRGPTSPPTIDRRLADYTPSVRRRLVDETPNVRGSTSRQPISRTFINETPSVRRRLVPATPNVDLKLLDEIETPQVRGYRGRHQRLVAEIPNIHGSISQETISRRLIEDVPSVRGSISQQELDTKPKPQRPAGCWIREPLRSKRQTGKRQGSSPASIYG